VGRVAVATDLEPLRKVVAGLAAAAGLDRPRVDRLVLAFSEIATNALLHGGGDATVWFADGGAAVVVTVHDSGRGSFPPASAARPDPEQVGGRGLWLARRLCDDVAIDSDPGGTTVRLTMRL
jgi:prepilin-type processing-associated H-X9-DG protein